MNIRNVMCTIFCTIIANPAMATNMEWAVLKKLGIKGIYFLIGALIIYLVWRYVRTNNKNTEDHFRMEMLKDAAHWCAKKTGQKKESVYADLLQSLEPSVTFSNNLKGIKRIDVELTKDSATQISRTVIVLLESNSPTVGKITRTYSWEDVPHEARSKFIRTGEKHQHYCLYPPNAQSRKV